VFSAPGSNRASNDFGSSSAGGVYGGFISTGLSGAHTLVGNESSIRVAGGDPFGQSTHSGIIERLPADTGSLTAIPSLGTSNTLGGSTFSFRMPDHSFQAPAGVTVSLEARLVNGQPLPGWLRFDPQRGVLSGQPPAGLSASVKVEVIIRDNQGHRASTVLDVNVGNAKGERPQSHWQPNSPQHLGDDSASEALAALLNALDSLTLLPLDADQNTHTGAS
jgi:fibronectin-binding autotransporter adhesin